jgi:hypothetical protein
MFTALLNYLNRLKEMSLKRRKFLLRQKFFPHRFEGGKRRRKEKKNKGKEELFLT